MKIAIFESIFTSGGHEIDFDRLLVEELSALGADVAFYTPQGYVFKYKYQIPVNYLPGRGVSYQNAKMVGKLWRSLKREFNRQRWFADLFRRAQNREFDAIIVPTATYRYLRALNLNKLKNSPVPVIFIMHGINPGEAPKFFRELEKLKNRRNIKIGVITLKDDIFGRTFPNLKCVKPPAYIPRDISLLTKGPTDREELKLGFFGQYRREKNLDSFIDIFLGCKFPPHIRLLVQGATVKSEDTADFERIIAKYNKYENISFLPKALVGKEWQETIAAVDALVMPYASERYLYHWAGMLFTAIGFNKPVIASQLINPEVMAKYEIGIKFDSGRPENLSGVLQNFVNTYQERVEKYKMNLEAANSEYSPVGFAQKLVDMCR